MVPLARAGTLKLGSTRVCGPDLCGWRQPGAVDGDSRLPVARISGRKGSVPYDSGGYFAPIYRINLGPLSINRSGNVNPIEFFGLLALPGQAQRRQNAPYGRLGSVAPKYAQI